MDDTGTAIGVLVILVILGACVGVGVISTSVWDAVGVAIALVLFLGFILYLVLAYNVDQESPGVGGYGEGLVLGLVIGTLLYLLPAAAVVAGVASIISNGGRIRRAPEDKT